MTFYALYLPGIDNERVELLKKACTKLGIKFQPVDPLTFDFSKPSPAKAGDLVYRVGRGKMLKTLENYFLDSNIVSFHNDPLKSKDNFFMLEKNKIPSPKTIFCPTKDRHILQENVKKLGGFPLIIKVLGGTRGMGVMKIDSTSALYSMVDFLLAQNRLITLRQYIPVTTSARLIVLGNKVIASLEYKAQKHDFRTNESTKLSVTSKKYSKDFEDLAIRATHALGWEFGGVDILIHNKKPYVTEVNLPCNFVRAQKVLKKDIALEIVKYLQEKSESIKANPV